MDLKTAGTVLLLSIPFMLLTVWAVVNAAQKDFGTMGKKVFWLFVAAVPFVGWLLYFALGAWKGKKSPDFL